jgi:hypothetical protein
MDTFQVALRKLVEEYEAKGFEAEDMIPILEKQIEEMEDDEDDEC